ncbi:MAG: ABC transporter permease subunit [Alphaproteobacteria bacterium]|nr:ABC transporter permease subunit [Alphaproteobacteria bacterium]
MRAALAVYKRELASYFITPLAYLFIVVFLLLTGSLTFFMGGFLERGQADLQPFFSLHPWVYLFLVPAVAMRLWSEERKTGSIELLLTLPVPTTAAVLGKFLAAWSFIGIALALTFPLWITVDYLGDPDHGVILASYIGSLLLAGAYLAIGTAVSAATRNQVIAFVMTAAIGFCFVTAATPVILDFVSGWAGSALIEILSGLSFVVRFESIVRGVIDATDLVFFLSVIGVFLTANTLIVDLNRGR